MSPFFTFIYTLMIPSVSLHELYGQNQEHEIDERIYNGLVATRGQFPYLARVVTWYSNGKGSGCGGSLISDIWVLSASHCAMGASSATVYFGMIDRQDTTNVLTYNIKQSDIYTHPAFDKSSMSNDVALYKLPSPVPFNDPKYSSYIKTINLPSRSQSDVTYFDNYNGTIAGWGAYNDTSGGSQLLRYAEAHIMKHQDCVTTYAPYVGTAFGGPINDGMICADKTLNHGICSGDSGGPLAVTTQSRGLTVVGISSFIFGSCSSKYPTIDAFVGKYLDWINNVTEIPIS